jgi:hypothetical protein
VTAAGQGQGGGVPMAIRLGMIAEGVIGTTVATVDCC